MTHRFTVVIVSGRQDLPSDAIFLRPLLKRKAFYYGRTGVPIFSKVPSGSE